uniref:legumain n=1 Tax=Kalanchoe fedtschenkoi TaxID=63787 RepID=A0A7N0V2H5_KALFE
MVLWVPASGARDIHSFINDNSGSFSGHGDHSKTQNVKKWAVLVAGSNYFYNYRHQSDVCHAYQILRNGGLRDENIIIFMYDDIAYNPENRKPGVILNKLNGSNVYEGVPKDYTGDQVNAENLYNVILANRSGLTGGSGKVLESGPNDHIFIYYADHGDAGLLGMPVGEPVYANDLLKVLKTKHQAKSYSEMVIYVEACESGSMFDGLLPENMNIYVTTAANPTESSYACYYDPELDNYLGDSYSVSWMEDSEAHDLGKETLDEQYQGVKKRTGNSSEFGDISHVMLYGTKKLGRNTVSDFFGSHQKKKTSVFDWKTEPSSMLPLVPQHEVKLYLLRQKYLRAAKGSAEMRGAKKQLDNEIFHRERADRTLKQIINALFVSQNASTINVRRTYGKPIVDDWDCFKSMAKTYEKHCGKVSTYGIQYTREMAKMCNTGIRVEQLASIASVVCGWGKLNN